MAKVKQLDCDLYKKTINIFIGTYEEMVEWAKQEYTSENYYSDYTEFLQELEEVHQGAADSHLAHGTSLIRLPKFPSIPVEIAEAVHECLHVTFYILSYAGVELTDGANEAFTYLHEWIVRNLLDQDGYKEVEASPQEPTSKTPSTS